MALDVATVSNDLGKLEGRVDALEAWQERQNGHLQRIDEKLDKLHMWLIGVLGSTIVSLVLLIVNLVVARGGR
jgi:hypothetical protein